MAATYNPATAKSKALDAVRALIGDTNTGKPLLDDGEIELFLTVHGLTLTSDPIANERPVLRAAARAALACAAVLSQKSEITVAQMGLVKSTAAREYRELAKQLDRAAAGLATVHFFNPQTFSPTHVAGIDTDPSEE